MQTMGYYKMREMEDELWAHRFRLVEDKQFMRYAMCDGDLEKVEKYKSIIAWRESEINRLSKLLRKYDNKKKERHWA